MLKNIAFECYLFGGVEVGYIEGWSFKYGPLFGSLLVDVLVLNCYGIGGRLYIPIWHDFLPCVYHVF
jgi:hypothetical protein